MAEKDKGKKDKKESELDMLTKPKGESSDLQKGESSGGLLGGSATAAQINDDIRQNDNEEDASKYNQDMT